MHYSGICASTDPAKAARMFLNAAEAGYVPAFLAAGFTQTDPEKAAHWFQKAALEQNGDAEAELAGLLLANGDRKEALDHFRKAQQLLAGKQVAETMGWICAPGSEFAGRPNDEAYEHFANAGDGNPAALANRAWKLINAQGEEENEKEAARLLSQAAAMGDALSQFAMAWFHTRAIGVPRDLKMAELWYSSAAAQGLPQAQNNLGALYFHSQGVNLNLRLARRLFLHAAKSGQPQALNSLGWIYENGLLVRPSLDAAMLYYSSAALAGNHMALYGLGRIYDKRGDQAAALELFERARVKRGKELRFNLGALADTAAEDYRQRIRYSEEMKLALTGNTESMNFVAWLKENGIGCQPNLEEARTLYSVAAEKGNLNAHYNLGRMLFLAKGSERNLEEAAKHLALSFSERPCGAGLLLGRLYAERKEFDKALSWYAKAGRNGCSRTLNNLGVLYASGYMGRTDYKAAFENFSKAEQQGDPLATYNLALLYRHGLGVKTSLKQAETLLRRAADREVAQAWNELGEITSGIVDFFGNPVVREPKFLLHETP